MEDIKYTITTDIQEEQPLKSIDMLLDALGRLQKAQIENDTGESNFFVTIGCNPKINDVIGIQVSYYYNKKAKFLKKFLNSDEFKIEVLMQYGDVSSNVQIKVLSIKDFEMLKKIFYDFVEKQIIPDMIDWEEV